jgi:signal transduction histidine kinase
MKRRFRISLATKFAATFAVLLVLIMLIVTFAVRRTVMSRLASQYERSAASSLQAIQKDLSARRAAIANQLQQFGEKLKDDNNFRLHVMVLGNYLQDEVLNYAENHIRTMGLQALAITNKNGQVLSSGHYRNAFGGQNGPLIRHLQTMGQKLALAWFQRPNGAFLCLAALDSVQIGPRKFYLICGTEITSAFLREFLRDTTEVLLAKLADSLVCSSPQWDEQAQLNSDERASGFPTEYAGHYSYRSFVLPVISENAIGEAAIFLLHPRTELIQLMQDLNRRLLFIFGAGIIIAVTLSVWRARAIAKPLRRLTATAMNFSFDDLDREFDVDSNDEAGVLNEALRNMVQRLRQNRHELAEAEQKAVLAEVARQVNHDLKNGFIPIRNVMQHWVEVAEKEPQKLIQVFNERQTTIVESLDYLENLARSYSRLRPSLNLCAVKVNQIVLALLKNYQDLSGSRIQFQAHLDPGDPYVQANAVQLRRAFENVLRNAIEAINDRGVVSVSTEANGNRVIITCTDSGEGIPEGIRQQMFKAYATTKPDGTGLGMVNVKRIMEDFGGTVTIESEAGHGTTVSMTLPQLNGAMS